jgi:hypothetical protein
MRFRVTVLHTRTEQVMRIVTLLFGLTPIPELLFVSPASSREMFIH